MFTVIIPTHNRARLVGRAIESVLRQTHTDLELIVVDDCSGDDTAAVVAAYSDQRVRYVRRAVNGGPAEARNQGVSLARNPWICFLDDDDELLPGFLERHAACIGRPGARYALAWSGCERVSVDGRGRAASHAVLWVPRYRTKEEAYAGFLASRRTGASGLVVRKDALEAIGLFDVSLRNAEDTDLLVRSVRAYDFHVVPEVLLRIHVHRGARLSTCALTTARSYERILEKNASLLSADRKVFRALHYKIGWLYYHAGDRRSARLHMARLLGRFPFHLKALLVVALFELLPLPFAVLAHRRASTWGRA